VTRNLADHWAEKEAEDNAKIREAFTTINALLDGWH